MLAWYSFSQGIVVGLGKRLEPIDPDGNLHLAAWAHVEPQAGIRSYRCGPARTSPPTGTGRNTRLKVSSSVPLG